jgi:hypothetical protein
VHVHTPSSMFVASTDMMGLCERGGYVLGVFGVPLALALRDTATVFTLDSEFPVRVPRVVATCLHHLNAEGTFSLLFIHTQREREREADRHTRPTISALS